MIEIDHGTFMARYGEVAPNSILVDKGDEVMRGQHLAYVAKLKGLDFSMLHLELYGTNESPAKAPLTHRAKPPFERRADLIDPTISIDSAVMK